MAMIMMLIMMTGERVVIELVDHKWENRKHMNVFLIFAAEWLRRRHMGFITFLIWEKREKAEHDDQQHCACPFVDFKEFSFFVEKNVT